MRKNSPVVRGVYKSKKDAILGAFRDYFTQEEIDTDASEDDQKDPNFSRWKLVCKSICKILTKNNYIAESKLLEFAANTNQVIKALESMHVKCCQIVWNLLNRDTCDCETTFCKTILYDS